MSRKQKPDPLPSLPEEMAPLWDIYLKLSSRRQAGMAPNPIAYSEIDAFCRLTKTDLSAWEVETLCKVDDAVMSAWSGEARSKAAAKNPPPAEIHVSDTKNMKALFQGLAARKRAERANPKPPANGGAHG